MSGIQTDVEVGFDDLPGDIADGIVADPSVVEALRVGISSFGPAKRLAVLVEEVFLLETEPGAWIVQDRSAGVGWVRRAVGHHDLAHHQCAVLSGGVGIRRETGWRTQSELWPSACRVELPSKPQFGSSSSFGKLS